MTEGTEKMVDHLFRHQYGKMVSSLVRLYGVQHIEMIEDAVQDTFHKALVYFRKHPLPDHPEAWFRTAARNRAIDLLRKTKSTRKTEFMSGPAFLTMNEIFAEGEIADNQLRLLFAICHPSLTTQQQVIFALKLFSGFSVAEISNGLLLSKENTKKILSRSRQKFKTQQIEFFIPTGEQLTERLSAVHLVIYLLFNEGLHSSGKESLVREELIAEAMRLNGLILERFDDFASHALMALMCFHSARLNSKIAADGSLIGLKEQDRKLWNYELIWKGHVHMESAVKSDVFTNYHWEAAIAGEHTQALNFEETNWQRIDYYYTQLLREFPSEVQSMNHSVIKLQLGLEEEAKCILENIDLQHLKGKEHLYYAIFGEVYRSMELYENAHNALLQAYQFVSNRHEKELIERKINEIQQLRESASKQG